MLPDPGRPIGGFAVDLEKNKGFFLTVFSLLLLAGICGESTAKLLWYDELNTFYLCNQPRLSRVLELIYSGQDLNPPLFGILTYGSLKLLGLSALALRIPEILGFWTLCLCLYHFVARRTSPLHGAIALLFPFVTRAYEYAYEARPYGLVLGFCGLALVFWQRAAEGGRRTGALLGLSFALACAVSCHFYAVLLYVPLGIGELMRLVRTKKPDLAVWLAEAVSTIPLLLFLRLVSLHSGDKSVYWAKAHWFAVLGFYGFLLQPAAIPAAILILVLAVAWRTKGAPAPPSKGPCAHEIAAAIAVALTPLSAMILAKTYTGAFAERYALFAVAGVTLLLAFLPAIYEDSRRRVAAVLAVTLYGYFVIAQVLAMPHLLAGPPDDLAKLTPPAGSALDGAPVVVTDGRVFLRMMHYCSPDMRRRLYYLHDHAASLKYLGFATVDDGLAGMTSLVQMNVAPYDRFVAEHKRFLVYAAYGSGYDWTSSKLVDDGARLELKGG